MKVHDDPMHDETAREYLRRIGATAPTKPDLESLADLMRRHLATVPFENLSIHLGEPIVLDEDALLAKIVGRNRGGFCYELNGAFAALLRHLGYAVTVLAARVITPVGLGPPFDHMTLRVDLDEPWLTDVGFGRFVSQPVRLDVRGDQHDPAGVVRVEPAPYDDLDVHLNGEPQFRMEQRPRDLDEFAATCWYHQSSPESHFTQSLACSLPTSRGRITLSGRHLITTVDGERTEQELDSDAAVLACYRDAFGIVLDRVPASPSARAV
jgi:N-hydroxyarylamine O-acetyltransferase